MSPIPNSRKRSLRRNVLLNSHLSIYHALTNPELDTAPHDPVLGGNDHDPEISRLAVPNPLVTTTEQQPDSVVDDGVELNTTMLLLPLIGKHIAPAVSPSSSPVSFPISLDVTPPPGNSPVIPPEYSLINEGLWQAIEESIKLKKVSSSILSSTTASDKDVSRLQMLQQVQRLPLYRHGDDYSVNPLFASSMVMVELNLQNVLGGTAASGVSIRLPTSGIPEQGGDSGQSPPLNSPLTPHVMVFETDEEDGNDGEDLDVELVNHGDCGASTTTTFIMPKMLLSTNNSSNESSNVNASKGVSNGRFNVVLVSLAYLEETAQLLKSLGVLKKANSKLNIYHINLMSWKHDDSLVRKANMVILVNDGSPGFVYFLSQVFSPIHNNNILPKLTIINMMTTNYFVNLLDLIQFWKPYQMWKTTSLNSDRILACLEACITRELSANATDDAADDDSILFGSGNSNIPEATSVSICSSMVYSQGLQLSKSSPPSSKPNYKHLEHQMKSEMITCSHYSDPLQLSSKVQLVCSLLGKLSAEYSNEKSIINDDDNNDDDNSLWMIYSFTVGMGLGIGLATSAATILGYLLSDPKGTITESPVTIGTTEKPPSSTNTNPILDIPVLRELLGFFTNSNWNYWFQMFSSDLRVVSSLVMECVGGGIMKVCNLILMF
ncbi:uncharacterized protein KQ657_002820 [Scheffersomyces spartinae]|uniref:Uncharacterized protein n=1 Tax=Scheffersomyces spartinae TaxID=45513 RepID=A0A9P7V5T3_9ASCO|nr:uncharacterized protein KQ657_002820 [Scheffersomyces spartinae]KAG7191684.1 hypothetical protein KQ657_002820 [Scheffersomyces spartinae]